MSASPAYERLHRRVQRWCWEEGWRGLRPIQERAIEPILAGDRDLILAAATAAGKTEAAFLPIASALIEEPVGGVGVLYVSPLKALINDQCRRLEEMSRGMGIGVQRWHGDVPGARKRAFLEDPREVLLITPESLEALFVLRGTRLAKLFGALRYVVIDEMHAFIGEERGRQLQSLLHRLEVVIERRLPRIGLSATLGDMTLAQAYLRPGEPEAVEVIEGDVGEHELKLGVRGVIEEREGLGEQEVARHLFGILRGTSNLVFASSRRAVESYAARLRDLCVERGLPQEFFAHHGSLARELREGIEVQLRSGSRPRTVVCTSTLEMGIDIGEIESVVQIGPPPSVAALRQRLGRSGRRGRASILRLYTIERAISGVTPLQDRLREELVQVVAVCELLLEGWCEPPAQGRLYLSTLVQQILSVIAERSGSDAAGLYRLLCAEGPWREIDEATFARLLRSMGAADLITQDAGGLLLTGLAGERLLEDYHFFAAFQTGREYRIVAGGQELGLVPIETAVGMGSGLILGGRRWRVVGVDVARGEVQVEPGSASDPPLFLGRGGFVHDQVRARMRRLYEETGLPAYLNATARALLEEGRAEYARLGLAGRAVVEEGGDALLLLWSGDRVLNTVATLLGTRGLSVSTDGMVLRVQGVDEETLWSHLGDLEAEGFEDPVQLALQLPLREGGKYDEYLSEELSAQDYAARTFDLPSTHHALRRTREGG